MVRWIQVKGVLSMYNEAAWLCCRVHGDSHLSSLARSRLVEQLADVDIHTRRDALAQYKNCDLSFKNADTLRLKLWLSSVYENFGMYAEADGLLFELDSKRFPSAIQFLENAQRRFCQRLFSQSVTPAFAAYQRTADPAMRSLAAHHSLSVLSSGRPKRFGGFLAFEGIIHRFTLQGAGRGVSAGGRVF